MRALLSIGSLEALSPYFKAASAWDGVLPLIADIAAELSTSPAWAKLSSTTLATRLTAALSIALASSSRVNDGKSYADF